MTGELRVESNAKWIRGLHGGRTVVDTRDSRLVWEHRYYPSWYVPMRDLNAEYVANGTTFESSTRGVGLRGDLRISGETIRDAAWTHPDHPALGDLVRIEWDALDTWYEEDVEVFVHPRSPEVRIDALPSSRHVRVLIDGEAIADSTRPTVLFETGLPPRYYLPMADVRAELLTHTDTETACPYKGWAHYWSVTMGDRELEDAVWSYRTPLPEAAPIAGLASFYPDKVTIEVDGHPI